MAAMSSNAWTEAREALRLNPEQLRMLLRNPVFMEIYSKHHEALNHAIDKDHAHVSLKASKIAMEPLGTDVLHGHLLHGTKPERGSEEAYILLLVELIVRLLRQTNSSLSDRRLDQEPKKVQGLSVLLGTIDHALRVNETNDALDPLRKKLEHDHGVNFGTPNGSIHPDTDQSLSESVKRIKSHMGIMEPTGHEYEYCFAHDDNPNPTRPIFVKLAEIATSLEDKTELSDHDYIEAIVVLLNKLRPEIMKLHAIVADWSEMRQLRWFVNTYQDICAHLPVDKQPADWQKVVIICTMWDGRVPFQWYNLRAD